MQILQAGDTINGQEGRATVNINGSISDLFFAKNIEATAEITKNEVKALGSRATQNKAAGWKGTGSMTIYYLSPIFRNMALQYIKSGKQVFFNLTIVNDDPGSTVGKQTTVLYGCSIDSVVLAKLDIDAGSLEEDVPFTFTDVDYLDKLGKPIVYK
jgi:hypothetical protein